MAGAQIGKSFPVFLILAVTAILIGIFNDKLNNEYYKKQYENDTKRRKNQAS